VEQGQQYLQLGSCKPFNMQAMRVAVLHDYAYRKSAFSCCCPLLLLSSTATLLQQQQQLLLLLLRVP
jgi:hypothetical protein